MIYVKEALSRVLSGLRWFFGGLLSLFLWFIRGVWKLTLPVRNMLRTEYKFSWKTSLVLAMLPFAGLLGLYMHKAYDVRYQEQQGTSTASSKLMPLPTEIWEGFKKSAFEEDNKGNLRLIVDTQASFQRFGIGMTIVALGIVIGMYMGTFPIFEKLGSAFFTFVDLVPPTMVLVILFLIFDVGEVSKIALIVVGVLPGVVRDAFDRAKKIPREQFISAQSLGASEQEIAWSVVFPQILPAMIGTLRLTFKAAWGYVIIGEALASSVGIGYRVYIMKRYVAMDTIMAYLLWATLIMFILDALFRWLESRFKWAHLKGV